MALLIICALAALAAGVSDAAAVYPPLNLPAFALADLQAPSAATLQRVGDAVSSLGMFAVTGFQVEHVAHDALAKFVSCAASGSVGLRQVTMDDGATRRTLATSTASGALQPLQADALRACPDFTRAAYQLRAAVAATGNAYAAVLDKLMYGEAACASPDACFARAVREAESLEHFHLFEPSAQRGLAEHMLAMHSDIGLFLVMSPAELFDRAGGAADAAAGSGRRAGDLVVQLRDGSVVRPVLPEGALLVMNGEGLTRWMRPPSSDRLQPYSPMHEVLSGGLDGAVRAWFGRMFMPPPGATLRAQDALGDATTTFADYRQLTYSLFNSGNGHEASTVGCSPARRLLVDESSCGADEVYCWMSCMKIPANVTCSKSDIFCANTKNPAQLWPRDYGGDKPTHCKDCALLCPAKTSGNETNGTAVLPPSTSSFCNTALGSTTMWMTGFQFAAGNEHDPCVVYLFPEWVLDSAGKFAGACIGTFFMGVVVGLLGRVRNHLKERWVAAGWWSTEHQPWWHMWVADTVIIVIVAVQLCLGYFLMLVAMTYQAELFIMVVLGLAFGHLFYRPHPSDETGGGGKGGRKQSDGSSNASTEPPEKLEPCCVA